MGHVPSPPALPSSPDEQTRTDWNGSPRHCPAGAKHCLLSGDCEPSNLLSIGHVPDRVGEDSDPVSCVSRAAVELNACNSDSAQKPAVVELGMACHRVDMGHHNSTQRAPVRNCSQDDSESSASRQQVSLCPNDELNLDKQTRKVADFRPSFLECIKDMLDEDAKDTERLPEEHGVMQAVRDPSEAFAARRSEGQNVGASFFPNSQGLGRGSVGTSHSSSRMSLQNEELGESSDELSQDFPPMRSNPGMPALDSEDSCETSSGTRCYPESCPWSLDCSLPSVHSRSSRSKAITAADIIISGSTSAEYHVRVQQPDEHLAKAALTGSVFGQCGPKAILPPLEASQSAVEQSVVTPVAFCWPVSSENSMSLPQLSLPALESSQSATQLSQPTPYLAPAIMGSQSKPNKTTDQDEMPQLMPSPLEVGRSASQQSLVPLLLPPVAEIQDPSQSIPQLSLPALEASEMAIHRTEPTPRVAPANLEQEVLRPCNNEDVDIKPSREPSDVEEAPNVDELYGQIAPQFSPSVSPPAAAGSETHLFLQNIGDPNIETKPSGMRCDARSCLDMMRIVAL